MADEIPMVSSCPLCLAPDEVESMVTVQIERAIPKGRAAIMICRCCTGAVIRAGRELEPPLLEWRAMATEWGGAAPAASEPSAPEYEPDAAPEAIDPMREMGFTEVYPCPADCELELAGIAHFHTAREKEERRDG